MNENAEENDFREPPPRRSEDESKEKTSSNSQEKASNISSQEQASINGQEEANANGQEANTNSREKANTNDQVENPEECSGNGIFFIDKMPGNPPEGTSCIYTLFGELESEPTNDNEGRPGLDCFNCGGNHHVNVCTIPRNTARIAQKRREMARNALPKKRRYFEVEMMNQRCQPGTYGQELRDAMSLRPNEVPPFVYRMRVLGYPPGWLQDAEIHPSGIRIFGLDDEEEDEVEDGEIEPAEEIARYDPRRLITIPGFNVPLPPGVVDLHKKYKMPPMQQHQQKIEAEKFFADQEAKYLSRQKNVRAGRAATRKPCTFVGPIGLDGVGDGQAGGPSTKYSARNGIDEPAMLGEPVYIPTPRDQLASTSLEAKAEEEKAKTSSENIVAGTVSETVQPDALPSMPSEPVCIPSPHDQLASTSLEAKAEEEKAKTSSENIVAGGGSKTVQPDYAVPSTSGLQKRKAFQNPEPDTDTDSGADTDSGEDYIRYTCIPPRENFAKGVSEYIPYENLPGATGTYERLRAVLKKARLELAERQKSKKDGQEEDGQA